MLSFAGDLYLKNMKKITIDFPGELIINLEYPIVKDYSQPAKNKVNLSAKRGYLLESLVKKPLAVCLANNHILDYGLYGAQNTLDYLKSNGIDYFGFGTAEDNYSNPYQYTSSDGKEYEIFAYCDHETSPVESLNLKAAPLQLDLIENDLKKANAEIIIVCLHWGDEENPYPSERMVKIAHQIADLGCHYIIGHHAHVIQPYENYNACHIYYNLGNFYFPDLSEPYGWDGNSFAGNYTKKQSSRNKESLVVSICNDQQNYTFYDSTSNQKIEKKLHAMKGYKFKNKIYNKIIISKIMFSRYINNPRMPSLEQIKRFLGI